MTKESTPTTGGTSLDDVIADSATMPNGDGPDAGDASHSPVAGATGDELAAEFLSPGNSPEWETVDDRPADLDDLYAILCSIDRSIATMLDRQDRMAQAAVAAIDSAQAQVAPFAELARKIGELVDQMGPADLLRLLPALLTAARPGGRIG